MLTLARLAFIIIPIVFASTGFAQTNVSGIISSDITWTAAESPYIVTGSVLVNSGVILTIEPGVEVEFDPGMALQIDGTLIARGTNADSITFTTSSQGNYWGYILFSDSSSDATYDRYDNYTGGSILEYCIVEYAGGSSVDHNGAVRIDNSSPFTNYCTIKNNISSGIIIINGTNLRINNNLIIDNNSQGNGGGINVCDGLIYITNCTINNNTASSHGGGISLGTFGGTMPDATITNCMIKNNTASSGGGIHAGWIGIYLSNNIISNNTASEDGGGLQIMYAIYHSNGTLLNNIITNNTASSYGGVYVSNSNITISKNIISNNSASVSTGGINAEQPWSETNTISNNTITGNIASNIAAVSISDQNFTYNTITGNMATGSAPTYVVYISSHPSFNYNNIFNNTANHDLWNDNVHGSPDVNAENNWWDSAIESEIEAKIHHWVDDSNKGLVDYTPFETTIRTDTPVSPPAGLTVTKGIGSITLEWYANSESDIAGYKVYWDTDSGYPYANTVDVGNVTSHTITGFTPATCYVTVTGYDNKYAESNDDPGSIVNENQTNGNESWYTKEQEVKAGVIPPDISLSATSLNFGDVQVGMTSSLSLVVSNNGGSTLSVSNIASSDPQFTVSPSTSFTVAAGGSQDVTVKFSPADIGPQTAAITVESNDLDEGTLTVSVSGNGVEITVPEIELSTTTLSIGNVNVNITGTITFTITNTGNAPLTVSNISSNNPAFTVNPTSANISPGDSLVVTITFSPISAGSQNATITVSSNDSDEDTLTVSVSGTGITPEIAIVSDTLNIGEVYVDSSGTGTFTIINNGTADLEVFNISSDIGAFTVNPASDTIAPRDRQDVTVTFTPREPREYSGTITITNNDRTVSVKVTGIGILEPLRIEHDPVTVADELSSILFTVRLNRSTGIDSVIICYDVPGKKEFGNYLIMKTTDGISYSCTLPAGVFTSHGLEYFITASDVYGTKTRCPEGRACYSITARVTNSPSPNIIQGGSAQNAYRMVSVPFYLPHNSIVEQLNGRLPGGEIGKDWRFFRYPPGGPDWLEYPDIEGFAPGKAFWIIVKKNFQLTSLNGTTVTTGEPFPITLAPGWNDIANPWTFTISWDDILNPSRANLGNLYTYEGYWSNPVHTMEPWKGYAIFNPEGRNVSIRFQPILATPVAKAVASYEQAIWVMTLKAYIGEARDIANHFGVRTDASKQWDKYDYVEPPPVGEYVSVYFPHHDWEQYPYDYTVDFRPPENSILWDFDVKTNIFQETVTINIEGIENLPEEHYVKIFDRDSKHAVDINNNTFSFVSEKNFTERHFMIVVSNTDKPELEELILERFVTAMCFPNPFNPSTNIRYELSMSGKVTISVYNIVGQQVKFYNLGQKDQGFHDFVFDASNLTSGVYFYKVDAEYAYVVGKILYIK